MNKMFLSTIVLVTFLISFISGAAETSDILKKAEEGNLAALNQAFVLLSSFDGANAEDIDISIGKSIIRNPKNFLTALKANRKTVNRIDAVLGNLGPDFVDNFKKQRNELEKRLTAIQTVDSKSLKNIRLECESELKRQILQRSDE